MTDLSIIIPVFNTENYVRECLESVMSQIRIEDITIECLIVDDCGTDESMQVVAQTISSYEGPINFRILKHPSNKGLSAARNTGIKEAAGEYLTFLDSDDYLFEDAIYNLFKPLRKYPESEIVQGEIQLSHPNKSWEEWLNVCAVSQPEYVGKHYESQGILLNGMPMTAVARIIKKSFILDNNLYFTNGMVHEDDMWVLEASQYIKNLSFCFTPVYYYRLNVSGSIQTNLDRTKSYLGYIDVVKRATEIYDINPNIEYFEYIYKKLDLKKRFSYWQAKINKSLISKKLSELYSISKKTRVPNIIKFMCWYNSLPAPIAFRSGIRFAYRIFVDIWHDKTRDHIIQQTI